MELRKTFWIELLEKFNTCSSQFKNVNASTDHWISSGSGVSGAPFSFIVTKNYAAVEVLINIGSKEENKKLYDKLFDKTLNILMENR